MFTLLYFYHCFFLFSFLFKIFLLVFMSVVVGFCVVCRNIFCLFVKKLLTKGICCDIVIFVEPMRLLVS